MQTHTKIILKYYRIALRYRKAYIAESIKCYPERTPKYFKLKSRFESFIEVADDISLEYFGRVAKLRFENS